MYSMRVIDPKQFQPKKIRHKHHKTVVLLLLGGVLLGSLTYTGFWINRHDTGADSSVSQKQESVIEIKQVERSYATPNIFTGNELRDLYLSVLLTFPNTEFFEKPPQITGNSVADKRIQVLAEERGFQLSKIPQAALVKTDEPLLQGETDDLLQPLAYEGWLAIKAAAQGAGIPLQLYSAYRSPEWQRDLFLQRLAARGITPEQIANGYVDGDIKDILKTVSIPGYSRHHTGYAVDFWCDDGNAIFAKSSCAAWLEKDNYLQAKQHGWIPSYPDGAEMQGPDPEPWEYVWVGKSLLFKD